MSRKIARFLAEHPVETPCLVVDLDIIAQNYKRLAKALPSAKIYYAVKANPAAPVLGVLRDLGSNFDTASIFEIEHCLAHGIVAERISFGSTIKKERDIAAAFGHGVRLFAFDSEAELAKLARSAPGAQVFCRIFFESAGAEWPLSKKFGCRLDMAADLLTRAKELGLDPFGVSFHVGSQQTDPAQWDLALGKTRMLFTTLSERGIDLKMVNLGGGFPARYRKRIPGTETYGEAILKAVAKHFGNDLPQLIVEPGRGVAGDAGVIQSEVVLIAQKDYADKKRWVYLDIGKFGGLPETMDEAIKYRIVTPHDGKPAAKVVLAGPTCDEVDVLYEKAGYELPLDLAVGDKVQILSTGAYTTTYSSVGFNGFPPLREVYI
ncbi:MAG: type III PLP-dependent enzyme [Rhodospirillaceae bacterium]|nr:type III PLP-dependent enzyme [Rhodospirillaceae bacterium]